METTTGHHNSQSRRNTRQISGTNRYYLEHRDAIIALAVTMFSDIQTLNSSYGCADSTKDCEQFVKRFQSEGLTFLSNALPKLMQGLFDYVQFGKSSYAGWKLTARAEYPVFLGKLFRDVYEGGKNAALSFSHIYQICVAFKKLKGPYSESVLREETRKFVMVDEEIGRISFNSEPLRPIITNARRLIKGVLKDVTVDPGDLLPRPGPGATNTPVDKPMRYEPHKVFTHLDDEFPYLEYFYSMSWDPHTDALRYIHLPVFDEAESRFKFVQKYLGKPRGICIEENEMQFFQQALKRKLYLTLELHPATRGRINFTSQDVNRLLALEASLTDEYITIDMSEASNRVARVLVHLLTYDTPVFWLLDAVSTRLIRLPNGDLHYAHMFAPMGSGVCFPVMALVHWALIRSIIRLSSIEDSENLSKRVYVYGDDIIVPTSTADAVYDYLPLFGMKINKSKSFRKGPFRESCGIHAYNGVDVTPVYVNYVNKNLQSHSDTTLLLSLIAKEYHFFQKGFLNTARCIRRLVSEVYWPLPFVGESSPVLGFRRAGRSVLSHVTQYARKERYIADLHCKEYSLHTIVPVSETVTMPDDRGYLRKLLVNPEQSATKVNGDVEDLMVVRRWLFASAL